MNPTEQNPSMDRPMEPQTEQPKPIDNPTNPDDDMKTGEPAKPWTDQGGKEKEEEDTGEEQKRY